MDGASDLLSSVGRVEVDNLRREELRSIYGKYNFKKSRTQPLVIDSSKEQVNTYMFYTDYLFNVFEF